MRNLCSAQRAYSLPFRNRDYLRSPIAPRCENGRRGLPFSQWQISLSFVSFALIFRCVRAVTGKNGTGTVAATLSACATPAYAAEPVPIFRGTNGGNP